MLKWMVKSRAARVLCGFVWLRKVMIGGLLYVRE
jgi:hypothetical protein